MSTDALFAPLQLGANSIENRFMMAPLTRARATMPGHLPNETMAKHYADRATAGLLIAEATMVAPDSCAFLAEPGIYSQEQVEGWKKTTEAVHAKGGKIFLQIVHGGRACHSTNNDGAVPVSATENGIEGHQIDGAFLPSGVKSPYEKPKKIEDADLPAYTELFVQAAKNAIAAGFDGVEVHAANGYLLDQFLRDSSNTRDGAYGGSLAGRAKWPLEVVKAVTEAIGADRVGVRLSPLNSYQAMVDSDPLALTAYLAEQLDALNVAYLHLMRADFFQAQKADVVPVARKHFTKGSLVVNMGYDAAEAAKAIEDKLVDAVAFGTKFLANPDFVARTKQGAELNELRPQFFYSFEEKSQGYNDYPFLGQ